MASKHPRKIGQYEVLGPLGKGAMGEVFKAVQPSLNRVVAIKVLPAEFAKDAKRVERFHREAQAIALLSHPNVVQIIDKDQDDDHLFFVMEYVPGTSLDRVLEQRRLSLREAMMVLRGICQGLEAAHRQNIVHRDLNPRNVLVSEDLKVVKLADFGISQVESISRRSGTLSTSEVSIGTLHYMAPEQAVDMTETDHRSDIYSVGVVFYEMLTGKVPVGRFSLPSQLNNEVPPDVDQIVLKCLSAEKTERYASVGRLLEAVGRLEDRLRLGLAAELRGLSDSTSKILLRSGRTLVRNRKLGLAVTAAFALVAVAAVMLLLGGRRAEESGGSEEDRGLEVARTLQVAPPERPSEPVDASPGPGSDPGLVDLAAEVEIPEEGAAGDDDRPGAGADASPAPSSTAALETELRVAEDKIEAKLYGPALSDLEGMLDEHGEQPAAARIYLTIADVHQTTGNIEDAKAALVEVNSRFPSSAETAEALYRLGRLTASQRGRGRDAEAAEYYGEIIDRFPRSPWAPRALAAKAATEEDKRRTASDPVLGTTVPPALLSYRRLVESYPSASETEGALWNLGRLYEDLKEFDRAAESYSELARRFPETRHDAWWKAGQLYDRKLDDAARARAAYEQITAGKPHYAEAQKRLQKLGN